MKKYLSFLLVIPLFISTPALAAGRGAFAGDVIGARPAVLGESFVAVADDANALRWNPAGLTKLLQPEFTSSHINFFALSGERNFFDYSSGSKAINEDFIGFALPNKRAPVGISILNLMAPGVIHADESGAIMENPQNYTERTISLSVGKRFKVKSFDLNTGLNLNRLSIISENSNSGFGIDGGILLDTPGLWPEVGLMLRGLLLNAKLGDEGLSVPPKTDLALAFSPWKFLKLVGGVSKTSGDEIRLYSTGMQLDFHWLAPIDLSFFGGLKSLGSKNYGAINSESTSWAAGIGTRISRYKLDYAYEKHSLMENTHRVTFGILQQSPVILHMDKGKQAFENLDDSTAIYELKETVYLSPRKAEAYYLLALSYERMRNKKEAIRLLEKVKSMDFDYFQEQNLDQTLEDIQELTAD